MILFTCEGIPDKLGKVMQDEKIKPVVKQSSNVQHKINYIYYQNLDYSQYYICL
jgi:hypothetical protein